MENETVLVSNTTESNLKTMMSMSSTQIRIDQQQQNTQRSYFIRLILEHKWFFAFMFIIVLYFIFVALIYILKLLI